MVYKVKVEDVGLLFITSNRRKAEARYELEIENSIERNLLQDVILFGNDDVLEHFNVWKERYIYPDHC